MEFLELFQEAINFVPPEFADVTNMVNAVMPWTTLAVALAVCFFGHKVHHLWAALVFFFIGIVFGILVGFFLPQLNTYVVLALALVLGGLGIVLSRKLLKFQIFFVNATLVYAALPGLLAGVMPETAAILTGLAVAVAVGLIAVHFKYIVTIITSSAMGAWAAAPILAQLLGWGTLPRLVALVVLLLAGLTIQFSMEKLAMEKERAEKHEQERPSEPCGP